MEQSWERSNARPTLQCSSYWKRSLLVALEHGCQLYLLIRKWLACYRFNRNCICYILVYMLMQKYTYICWIHTDAINKDAGRKTQEDFFIKIFTSHFIYKVQKGCSRFACERELETDHNWNILTPKLWPSALCLSRSPWLLNRSLGVCWVLAFPTSSGPSLLQLYCLPSFSPVWLVELNSSALYYLQTPTQWYGHASATSSDI